MARWNSTLTDAGINMLANVTDERALQIVRMACGSGSCAAADMRTQTALTNYVTDIPITASRQISDTVYEVEGTIDNAELETGFYLKQVGIFAKLEGLETEVLFMLIQVADGDAGDRIPSYAESPGFLAVETADLVFSAETNIEITVDSGSVASVKAYVDAKIAAQRTVTAELTHNFSAGETSETASNLGGITFDTSAYTYSVYVVSSKGQTTQPKVIAVLHPDNTSKLAFFMADGNAADEDFVIKYRIAAEKI